MLLACKITPGAKKRAAKALAIDGENWRASSLLASKVSAEEGIEILKPVISRLGSDHEWQQCYLNRSGYSTMYFILAEKTLWLPGEGFYAAIYFVKTAMRIEPTDYPRDVRFLQMCADRKEWLHYIELLETIANRDRKSVV